MSDGVHIRAFVREEDSNPEISMLELQIFPLPTTVIEELALFLRDHVNEFLTEHKIAAGTIGVFPTPPQGSKLN